MIVPDSHLSEALEAIGYWNDLQRGDSEINITTTSPELDVVARYGPEGSRIVVSNTSRCMNIPAAALETPNGQPKNPTGAGNAYSAALSTCRAKGLTLYESACIATAIGAVLCEYEHMPPWNWQVLSRIHRAAVQVQEMTTASSPAREKEFSH